MKQSVDEAARVRRLDIVARLADDIAHEIKNPLNSMVITLELMRTRVRKNDIDGVLERADVLEGEIRRLNSLVDALLRLLRPDRSGDENVSVAAVLDDLTPLLTAKAKLARVAFSVEALPADAFIRTDREALRFALLHVVVTVLDRSPEDGSVAVAATMANGGLRITISSTGSGAAADHAVLADARALVDVAGGTISAGQNEQGLIVDLDFPATGGY